MNILSSIIPLFLTFNGDTTKESVVGFYLQQGEKSFCSSSFNLVIDGKDSLFFNEGGCEGRSEISFGKFTIKTNIIEFIPQYIPYFKGFKIDTLTEGGITFQLVDINEKPIVGQELNIYPSKDYYNFLGFYSKDSGIIRSKLDSLSSFKIGIPYKLKKEWERIDFKIAVPCLVTLYFNFPRAYLIYPHTKEVEMPNFKFILKKDGFYDLKGSEMIFKKEPNPDKFWRSHVVD